jgi:hypothetical protein
VVVEVVEAVEAVEAVGAVGGAAHDGSLRRSKRQKLRNWRQIRGLFAWMASGTGRTSVPMVQAR